MTAFAAGAVAIFARSRNAAGSTIAPSSMRGTLGAAIAAGAGSSPPSSTPITGAAITAAAPIAAAM